ncbi:hypothetical protein DFP92_12123 [Yoonia sediminilitoris]|uniref:Uncharacterized protein n=1 Tax=Yoonia sediminilitoris TaxID=1286148 RepID=A0A2T6K675_9RHOB|nr:hypothetical protein C8N45_12123 [Yoonia sediminilitoris]RCW89689.1 hypothetical protein DFP92_12123 [Yoonia sediminilitoris]
MRQILIPCVCALICATAAVPAFADDLSSAINQARANAPDRGAERLSVMSFSQLHAPNPAMIRPTTKAVPHAEAGRNKTDYSISQFRIDPGL